MERTVITFVAILVLQSLLLAQATEPQPEWLTRQATIRATVQVIKPTP